MDYGGLVREAWTMTVTRRYRFLWVLGLLAGGGSVMLPSGGVSQPDRTSTSPQADPAWLTSATSAFETGASAWVIANFGLLLVVALFIVGLVLALIVSSFIAQGSIVKATTDIATGQPSSLSGALSAGLRLFWRYVGLWSLLIGAAVAVFTAFGVVVAIGALAVYLAGSPAPAFILAALVAASAVAAFVAVVLELTRDNGTPQWKVTLWATVFALPIFTILIVVGLSLSIVVAFAQRAIVVENVGPIGALRSGWRLMRAHIAESLMTWLINAALALISGIAGSAAVVACLLGLVAIGALVYATAGIGTTLFAYAGLGGLVLVLGGLTLVGLMNTFFWSYWTLVYLQLSGREFRDAA